MEKICFVNYDMSARGGVEAVTAALANALVDKYEVHLISLCFKNDTWEYPLDERVKKTYFSREERPLRLLRKRLAPQLKLYFQQNRIRVALCQGHYAGFIASAMRGITKTKLVFCDHGALMNQWNEKDTVAIRLISSLLCHKVVTLTEQSKNDYYKKF